MQAPKLHQVTDYLARNTQSHELHPTLVPLFTRSESSTTALPKGGVIDSGGLYTAEPTAQCAGTLLCFVHADSRPPPSTVALVRQTLSDGRTVLGGFRVVIKHGARTLRWFTLHQLIKTYYAPLLFRPLSFAR